MDTGPKYPFQMFSSGVRLFDEKLKKMRVMGKIKIYSTGKENQLSMRTVTAIELRFWLHLEILEECGAFNSHSMI